MRYDHVVGSDVAMRQRKLRQISRVAEWIALSGIALIVTYSAYLCWDRAALTDLLERDVPGVAIPASYGATAFACGLSFIPCVIFVVAMWEARQLFRLLGANHIFSPATPRHLVRLGALAFMAAVAGIIVRTLVVLLLTSSNPSGERHLVIGVGSNEIAALVAGLLFLAFALVMQEALRIENDNRSIV